LTRPQVGDFEVAIGELKISVEMTYFSISYIRIIMKITDRLTTEYKNTRFYPISTFIQMLIRNLKPLRSPMITIWNLKFVIR